MKALSKIKDQARLHEQREEWEKAVKLYLEVLQRAEQGEGEVELSLFNRIGDLYLRLGRAQEAVRYFEDAADHYAEAGLYNNAIALCSKALRHVPDHLEIYRKLGRFSVSQGFLTDARRWFLEYAERRLKRGDADQAFAALSDLATLTDDPEARELLGRHLLGHGRAEEGIRELQRAYAMRVQRGDAAGAEAVRAEIGRHSAEAVAALDEVEVPTPASVALPEEERDHDRDEATGFQDIRLDGAGEPAAETPAAGAAAAPLELAADAPGLDLAETRVDLGFELEPAAPGLEEGEEPLAFELPELEPPVSGPAMEMEPGVVSLPAPGELETEFVPDHDPQFDIAEPLPTLEEGEPGTASADAGEFYLPTLEPAADEAADEPAAEAEPEPADAGFPSLPLLGESETPAEEEPALDWSEAVGLPELEMVEEEEARAAPSLDDVEEALSLARTLLEHGQAEAGLAAVRELQSRLSSAGRYEEALEVVEEALRHAPEDAELRRARDEFLYVLDRAEPPAAAAPPPGAEPEAAEETPETDDAPAFDLPTLEEPAFELTAPAEPATREPAAEAAAAEAPGFELPLLDEAPADEPAAEEPAAEEPVAEEPVAGEPVAGEPVADEPAVEETTVAGWEPEEPWAPAAEAAWGPESLAEPEREEPARPAEPGARGAGEADGYVDLGALIFGEEEEGEDTTRWTVAEQEPSGDEDRDFADLLSQFRDKIAEHVGEDDPESHYDLGIAFKEMGLYDEAIGQFQVALRGGHAQLKVYEELGQCFLLKEQYGIAAKVFTRALQLPREEATDLRGVYYHLGRAYEALGRGDEARDAFERVVGLDIRFMDAADRLARL